jgi:eukaryotic-like serine/threonine-protein kinase
MSPYPVKFGKYLLLERINVGGMAEVFKAKTFGVAGFERILAIKRILPSLVEDDEFIRMFIDEARIAVQLNHANIVQIYELGKHGEHYYIAMEYLPSRDVRTILDRMRASGQLMPIGQAAYICSKACEGLDYAHRRRDPSGQPMNIVHRDVSPQNILITFEGEVKVIDFGIAKAANRASKTQAGVLKGKFGYMSPEQVRGLPIDRRSDIFAVGVLLYEMLTGERLFIGESDFSTLERVRNADVIPPTTFNKKITPELEQIVLKALARETEDRYQWSSDLAEDLQGFLIDNRSLYNAKRLALFMKDAWAAEIASERSKMEQQLDIALGDGLRETVSSDKDLPAPDAQVKLEPARGFETNTDPLPKPKMLPLPAEQDGFDIDAADELGEDKTFVIEASEAGKALVPSKSEDAAHSDDPAARPPRVPEITNDDFLRAASLYGEDASELEDDSSTMVSTANPFDEGIEARTDAEREASLPPHASGPKTADPDSETHAAFDYAPPLSSTSPSLQGRPAVSITHEDDIAHSAQGIVQRDGAFEPVTAAMAQDMRGLAPSLRAGSSSSPLASDPKHAAPLHHEGPDATQRAPRYREPRQKLSGGATAALFGGVAMAFLAFLSVALVVVVRLMSGGEVSLVLAPPDPGNPPANAKVFLEGELVAESLPTQVSLPQRAGLRLRVEAMGFETLELVLPRVDSSLSTLTLPLRSRVPEEPEAAEPTVKDPGVVAPAVPAEEPLLATSSSSWRVSFTAIADGSAVHGARVFREGRFLGVTPFEGELSAALERADFEVRAEGFATKQLQITRGGRAQVGPATVRLVRPPEGVPETGSEPTPGEAPAPAAVPEELPPAEPPAVPIALAEPTGQTKAGPPPPAPAPVPAERPPEPQPPPVRQPPAGREPPREQRKGKPKLVELALGTSPFAQVWVDGTKLDRTTPLMGARALKLAPGTHTFQFLDPRKNTRYRYKITIPADSPTNKIIIILGGDVRVKEGKATAQEL